MALVRRFAPGLVLLTWVAACNALFGIEEGTPRPASPETGGEPPSGGTGAGATSGAAATAGTTNGGATSEGGAGANGGATDGGATNEGGAGANGGGGSGDAGAGGEPEGCDHAQWPARPKPGNATSVPQFTLAAHTLVLNETNVVGRDLDNACTCPAASTCKAPSPELVCDGLQGRDTSGNQALSALAENGQSEFSEAELQKEIVEGRAGIVLRVTGYNGAADDERVGVEVFGKVWKQAGNPSEWLPYEDSVANGRAVEADEAGYVSNFTLVARLPRLSLAFRPQLGENDNALVVELEEAVLSGTLEPGGGSFILRNGNIAGRWPTTKILGAFRVFEFPDPFTDSDFMCEDNLAYLQVKSSLCKYADIMSSAALDELNGVPTTACDAISFAAGFDTSAATLGTATTPEFVPTTCPVTWQPTCR